MWFNQAKKSAARLNKSLDACGTYNELSMKILTDLQDIELKKTITKRTVCQVC